MANTLVVGYPDGEARSVPDAASFAALDATVTALIAAITALDALGKVTVLVNFTAANPAVVQGSSLGIVGVVRQAMGQYRVETAAGVGVPGQIFATQDSGGGGSTTCTTQFVDPTHFDVFLWDAAGLAAETGSIAVAGIKVP